MSILYLVLILPLATVKVQVVTRGNPRSWVEFLTHSFQIFVVNWHTKVGIKWLCGCQNDLLVEMKMLSKKGLETRDYRLGMRNNVFPSWFNFSQIKFILACYIILRLNCHFVLLSLDFSIDRINS